LIPSSLIFLRMSFPVVMVFPVEKSGLLLRAATA
jgi:hypothetical protein